MTTRSQTTDKWHRTCNECGTIAHINAIEDGQCPDCGGAETLARTNE